MQKVYAFTLFLLLLNTRVLAAERVPYLIKRHESLSQIARANLKGQLYGAHGQLRRLISMNPQIQNPNFIFFRQKIWLPKALSNINVVTARASETHFALERKPAQAQINLTPESPLEPAHASPKLAADSNSSQVSSSELVFIPGFALSQLSAFDPANASSANLLSKSHIFFDGYLEIPTSDETTALMGFHLDSVEFLQPTDPNKRLTSENQFTEGFSVGARHKLSESFHLTGLFIYQNELFIRSVSTNLFAIDALPVPSVLLKADWDFYSKPHMLLGGSAKVALDLPASSDHYSVKSGYTWGADLFLQPRWSKDNGFNFRTKAGVATRTQDTNLTQQSQMDLNFSVVLMYPLEHSTRKKEN